MLTIGYMVSSYCGLSVVQCVIIMIYYFRCFLGSNAGPAQWPDCNRYVESIISKLCDQHPTVVRSKGTSVQRWSLVMKSYQYIRNAILSNAHVMAKTKLQLVEINQTTISQW